MTENEITDRSQVHEQNRKSWNEATRAHNSHKLNQAGFLRSGGSTLFQDEINLVGNVSGLEVLHLMCNSGQDTISLANLGARLTGVDISDEAIEFAQQLSTDSGIKVNFIREELFTWLKKAIQTGERFDLVFMSYGVLPWISKFDELARHIHQILNAGGRWILIDFHPLLNVFEDDWSLHYGYFQKDEPTFWPDGIGDYVAMSGQSLAPSGYSSGVTAFKNPQPCYEYQWTLGDILDGLVKARLQIIHFEEYPHMNGARLLDRMRQGENNRYYPPADVPALPLMFSFIARKPK